jgi:hypothetical protein
MRGCPVENRWLLEAMQYSWQRVCNSEKNKLQDVYSCVAALAWSQVLCDHSVDDLAMVQPRKGAHPGHRLPHCTGAQQAASTSKTAFKGAIKQQTAASVALCEADHATLFGTRLLCAQATACLGRRVHKQQLCVCTSCVVVTHS